MDDRELRVVLTVDDFNQAVAFFRDELGLPQSASWQNDGGHAVLLDAGRATLEIFDEAQADAIDRVEVGRRVAGRVRLAFLTPDSDAMARKLIQAGGKLIAGPVVTPWGDTNVRLESPGGVQLTLFAPSSERM